MEGWPEHVKQVPRDLKPFWQLRDDLSVEHGCVLFQGRFYIPQALRSHCLKTLHQGHLGITKMRVRALAIMYCTVYHVRLIVGYNRWSQPFLLKSQVDCGKKLGMDLFFQGRHWYVIIADYYSKYPWIKKSEAISYEEVMSFLMFCFPGFGIPEEVISDNGKQFTGREYQDFVAKYGFKLTISSPYHPKDHGFIERQVQTMKNLLNKCDGDGTDHYLALLQLRAIPMDSRLPSPDYLFPDRQLKTTLPAIIRPPANNESTKASLQSRKGYTSCDAHAKELPQLLPR